ncbi:MAG: YjbH domain-containing protein [Burkholderiales bacterium]|nr:YjbH domain-containing protein [Burkholderiales bacterium]
MRSGSRRFFIPLSACLILYSFPVHAERLSDWLLEQPFSPDAYPLGLIWKVPGERVSQNELRFDLLKSLSGLDPEVTADPGSMRLLRNWISTLAITGRAPVAVADARWLQANPSRDPVIMLGDGIELPMRPRTVTVVTASGRLCRVQHAPNVEAMDYVEICSPNGHVDWAYMAQPDGKVQRFGVAAWNREKQDEPAPGAWIWAPPRDGGWSGRFSEKLIAFLATQGPAPDSMQAPAVRGGASQAWPLSDFPEIQSSPILPAPIDPHIRSRSLVVTSNDWGQAGLLQNPTARMRSAGEFSFTLNRVYPYTRGNVSLQPLDWLEVGFRYTNISNRLYGPASLSGSQAYKHKSIDVKFNLMNESAYEPQLAVGLRDLAGTALFGGEYLVASKRTGPLDWSLGLGWGYVGGRGNLGNPLGLIGNVFKTRTAPTGTGNLALSSYFRGPTALFGGVQYQSPWEPLILKLEYDGNNYRNEPLNNPLAQGSPWNFAAVYRASNSVDLTAGMERGNTAMFSISLHTQLADLTMPKLDDPPRVPVAERRPEKAPDWAATSRDIAQQTNWHVGRIADREHELRVTIDDANNLYWRDYLDRAAAVLHRDAPASVDRFVFVYRERGMEVAQHEIDREAWVEKQTRVLPPSGQREAVIAGEPERPQPQVPLYEAHPPVFESKLGMNFNYNLGGPNGFILYQIAPIVHAKLRFNKDTWLQGGVQYGVLDNFNKFTYDAPSNLPRVRTYLREYMVTSKATMPNLQLTHVGSLGENQYYSLYGGYLEEMFAGVGGEWLYRPFAGRTALGVDANAVRQRNFAQDFGLRNYNVLTGHATLYWDTGWNDVLANLSAGRYLAGDMGVTVELSRAFKNGVRMGAFFTKTNVSAQQFGEGSFDKGIYVTIPFDAMLTKSSDLIGNLLWRPLTRDGGAKLSRQIALYDLTQARDDRRYEPAPLQNDLLIPEDRREGWKPAPLQPYVQIPPRPTVAQWVSEKPRFEQKLREALYARDFRNIGIAFDGSYRLSVSLSSERIRPDSRAVGRAARTILLNAPLGTREIRITFAEHVDPVVTYDFFDLPRLKRYLNGELDRNALKNFVDIEYINPSAREADPLACLDDPGSGRQDFSDVFLPDMRPVARVERDIMGAVGIASDTDWLKAGAIGAGLVLGSSLLDKPADNFARNHAANSLLRNFDSVGNALPWVESAGAAMVALGSSDPRLSRTGYAASEAAVTSYLAVVGLKYAVGRARPWTGQGSNSFNPFAGSAANGTDGFPSGHTIVAWAVATPFAEEYDAPWLYGVAALTNFARVGSRNHWVSDTVAGSFLGYGIGKFFWESSRKEDKDRPFIMLGPTGVNVSWKLQ